MRVICVVSVRRKKIVMDDIVLVKSSKVMFCRVCGFRVRVWESYRTSRSFGHGYGSVTELTQVPGIVARAYRSHRSSGRIQKCCTRTPGIVARGLQNSHKFRVRVLMSYRTHRSSGYGYESLTERPEVPGIAARAYRITEVPGRYKNAVPVPLVLWHGRTDLTEVPGTGMNCLLYTSPSPRD